MCFGESGTLPMNVRLNCCRVSPTIFNQDVRRLRDVISKETMAAVFPLVHTPQRRAFFFSFCFSCVFWPRATSGILYRNKKSSGTGTSYFILQGGKNATWSKQGEDVEKMKNNVWVGIELNTSAVRLISSVDESLVRGRGPCFEDKNL